MTSFNAPTILMALDEYYENHVQPKPRIPKHYGHEHYGAKRTERQAARLQSYRDCTGDDDEEDDEEEEDDPKKVEDDEFETSIQDTNRSQINFETNDFNQLYQDTDNLKIQNNSTKPAPVVNMSASSAQWRIKPNNVNRPAGAPPLVSNDAPRNQPRPSHWGRGYQNRRHFNRNNQYHNYNNNNRNNNNNRYNQQNSVHNRLGFNSQRAQMPMEQCMRNGYNGAPNNNNYNNNIQKPQQEPQQPQQVLMNIKNHFQNGRPQLNVTSQLNPSNIPNSNINGLNINQFKCYQNQSNAGSNNWQLGSNSLTSLVNSANHNNNVSNRLGPSMGDNSNYIPFENSYGVSGFGHPNLRSRNTQLQRVPGAANGCIVGSESLRLADLMNMDTSSCKNLNVAEVAKNAMLLLSTVFHKPILNEDVQQELSHLQQKSGLSEEPHGLEMNISPETTELRMYHRFK